MRLDVLDADTLARVGWVKVWHSLYWDSPYYSEGSFTLEVRPTAENLQLLQEGRWLVRSDENPRIPMRICSRTNQNEDSNLVVSGYPATWLLTKRVSAVSIKNQPAEAAMRSLVSAAKPWPRLELGTEYGFDTTFEKQTSGGSIFDYCQTIGQACDLGFRIVLDGKGSKKKKRIRWWQILLITLLVIALIFGGAFALIMGAITPEGGNIKLNQLINTPKEFQGKELNFLMVGIDRSSQKEGDDLNDAGVDDGNTDMILYVHFNNETGEMKMLQIPRDTMVTTDRSVSGNYRINNIAKTQAADSNSMNMAALCTQVSNMYQLPIDGYMTIRLEMLVQLVDTFGGIELYVPQEMDYKGSHLDQGYQTLNGDACEFLLRTRHIYNNGDIGRLNMQRQFYSALFRRLKSIGNIWDVAKLTPAVLNYMETSLSASQLVSFAVSMLKIDSSKIMICQMPIKMAGKYNGQAVVYPARQEDADILNQYFRENTGFVDASELQLCDDASVLGFDLSGYTATDANVQYMGQLNQEAADAQQNQNLDGSHTVEYVDSESTDTADSSSDSTESESQPAA